MYQFLKTTFFLCFLFLTIREPVCCYDKMTPPSSEVRTFSRTTKDDRQYTCTTDPKCIDLMALSAALDSELIWWAGPLNKEDLRKMVDHSWCFSLYHVTDPDQYPGCMFLVFLLLLSTSPLILHDTSVVPCCPPPTDPHSFLFTNLKPRTNMPPKSPLQPNGRLRPPDNRLRHLRLPH